LFEEDGVIYIKHRSVNLAAQKYWEARFISIFTTRFEGTWLVNEKGKVSGINKG